MDFSFPSPWIKFIFIKKNFHYKSNSFIVGKKSFRKFFKKSRFPFYSETTTQYPGELPALLLAHTLCSTLEQPGKLFKAREAWDTPPEILISLVWSDFMVWPSVFFKDASGDSEIQGKLGSTALGPFQCVNPLPEHRHTHTTQTCPGTQVYMISSILLYFLLFSLNNILWIVSIVNKSIFSPRCNLIHLTNSYCWTFSLFPNFALTS